MKTTKECGIEGAGATNKRIRKGDTVRLKPEWQDPGDNNFHWVAADDEELGRVTITPTDIGLAILPLATVDVTMLER